MTPSEIDDLLAIPLTGVLSTLDRSGAPHSAAMWFAPTKDELHMWTYAKSQKAVNLRRDPRCAFLVEEGATYDELRGVLVKAEAKLVTGYDEIVAIGKALYDRYTLPASGVDTLAGPIAEIERQARKRMGISLPLDGVASWDHSKLGRSLTT